MGYEGIEGINSQLSQNRVMARRITLQMGRITQSRLLSLFWERLKDRFIALAAILLAIVGKISLPRSAKLPPKKIYDPSPN